MMRSLWRETSRSYYCFEILNQVPLNQANPDLPVNFLEYWQVDKKGKITKFSWVTDLTVTRENVVDIMRAGRARWKIESVPQAHSKEVRLWTDRLWRSYTKDEGRPLDVGLSA